MPSPRSARHKAGAHHRLVEAPSRHRSRNGRVGIGAWLGLACALAFPAYVLHRHAAVFDWRLLYGIPCLASATAYVAYRIDKRRAAAGAWRISELTLHTIEMCGGWPGAFLAQRRLRHKISKRSYQCTFWLIIALHHLVAADSLAGWQYARMLIEAAH